MHVTAVKFTIRIPGATSLKEKRRVVKSICEGMRSRFGIAVAEVGSQDIHQRAEIGIAAVSGETHQLRKQIHSARRFLESNPLIEVTESQEFAAEET